MLIVAGYLLAGQTGGIMNGKLYKTFFSLFLFLSLS